ncbi:MAG: arsenite methyltransferase [Spirochaetota bacterium]|nr:arsenite methyltransferase [Spirochaetota bacterium]
MNELEQDILRNQVRETYKEVAISDGGCGTGTGSSSCCAPTTKVNARQISEIIGYSQEDLAVVPEGANLGLGCGTPLSYAKVRQGETILDLGSGAGFDAFIASKELNGTGKVLGVDMTPEMISKARTNAESAGIKNVEFRLGEIENLPIADNSIDVIISNCVINLSPNKPKVYNEIIRVLKPGGRVAISDVVATTEIPEEYKGDPRLISGCMGGASTIDDLQKIMEDSGFEKISIRPKDESREFIKEWAPETNITDYVVSAIIEGLKPE